MADNPLLSKDGYILYKSLCDCFSKHYHQAIVNENLLNQFASRQKNSESWCRFSIRTSCLGFLAILHVVQNYTYLILQISTPQMKAVGKILKMKLSIA